MVTQGHKSTEASTESQGGGSVVDAGAETNLHPPRPTLKH